MSLEELRMLTSSDAFQLMFPVAVSLVVFWRARGTCHILPALCTLHQVTDCHYGTCHISPALCTLHQVTDCHYGTCHISPALCTRWRTAITVPVTFRQLSALCIRWRTVITRHICVMNIYFSGSGWPCGLKRKSATDWVLGWRVRTPLRAWLYVSCVGCVLCRERPLRRADHPVRRVLSVVFVSNGVRDLETSRMRWPLSNLGSRGT